MRCALSPENGAGPVATRMPIFAADTLQMQQTPSQFPLTRRAASLMGEEQTLKTR